MTDSPLNFVHPEFANGLWFWVAGVLALIWLESRGRDALDRLVGPVLQDRLVDRPSRWRRWARLGLLGTAGFAMIIALMQPQWGSRFIATPRVGAEIMIALDVSRSMLADDAKPTRLERAKAEISDLLSYLKDDHVGLIAFAGRATVLSPMTPDKSFLRLALDRAGPHVVSRGGTNLAEPILRAVAGMGEPGPAQRALILITDGEDHDAFAMDAARTAAEAGIKIITIGFGDEAGSQIYLRDPKTGARSLLRDADGQAVVSRLNGDLLREIALVTDGAFVPAGTGVLDLASIYDAHIAPLTRGQLDRRGRRIRDEGFQFFVLLAIVCLVAAVSIASVGRRRPSRGIPLALVMLVVPITAPTVEAQPDTPANDVSTEADVTKPDPRTTFNRGNEKLGAGDAVAAMALLRAARRDATNDVLLRYAATYNLGMAAFARAESLETENASEALVALHEAANWFREAVVARPDESAPRHNLDVTLRRALILSDQIAQQNQQELDAELDEMIEAQRRRVAASAGLLEAVMRSGELAAAEELRPAFRESATQQRLILSDANALGERIARERERLVGVAEDRRTPEDVLEAAQLEAVLVHLDSAIDRMGQTRRQLRQRRAERAYRRGSSALGDLKRARDQLRGLVPQLGILLAEVGGLASMTEMLAGDGRTQAPVVEAAQSMALPAYLTRESVAVAASRIEARVAELAARLDLAASQALASAASAAATQPPPGASDEDGQGVAFTEAAPLVAAAARAMDRVAAAIVEGEYDLALREELDVATVLAEAQERFFDLRQLLNAAHSDQQRIAKRAGLDEPSPVRADRGGVSRLAALQSRNNLRGLRLQGLLERERNDRIAGLESEDPDPDSIELERRRFELADQLLVLARDAMLETTVALADGNGEGVRDWPRVEAAASRATEKLDAIRTLFFSIAEHLQKLALDQLDVHDRTRDMIALSVTDTVSASEPEPEPEPERGPRGPETRLRARELASDQQGLESRAGEIADALFVQAEEIAQGVVADAAPDATAERDRIRMAAEHVALAQLAMTQASESLESESPALTPAPQAQALAVDELNAALELLSPPPPPDESEPESEDSPAEEESQGAGDDSEDAGEERMDDPSQLLQGVRDRDAERRRERDREARRRRTEPVDKDW